MARIVYGVMGNSLGHVFRSQAVAETLPQHEFLFVGGGSVSALGRAGYSVALIPILDVPVAFNRIPCQKTPSRSFLKLLPAVRLEIGRVARLMERFQPDLVITDWEFFTQWAARRVGLPCISLDNQHMLTHCRFEPPPGYHASRLICLTLMRLFMSAASHYVVSSFYEAEAKDPAKTDVCPPILRAETERHRASPGEYGVVYLRGGLPKGLAKALTAMKRPYIVYGMGRRAREANLSFKPFSESEFLSDLASSAYYVCNGGHTGVSEALYYGKPVLCRQADLFYEQAVNCHLLAKAGYGEWVNRRNDWEGALRRLENELERYASRVRARTYRGNDLARSILERLIRGNGHVPRG